MKRMMVSKMGAESTLAAFTSVSTYPTPYAFFRNMGDPVHFTAPLAMMVMRSPRMSASSIK